MRQPVDGSGPHACLTLPRPGAQANLLLPKNGRESGPLDGRDYAVLQHRIKQGFRLAQTLVYTVL